MISSASPLDNPWAVLPTRHGRLQSKMERTEAVAARQPN